MNNDKDAQIFTNFFFSLAKVISCHSHKNTPLTPFILYINHNITSIIVKIVISVVCVRVFFGLARLNLNMGISLVI